MTVGGDVWNLVELSSFCHGPTRLSFSMPKIFICTLHDYADKSADTPRGK